MTRKKVFLSLTLFIVSVISIFLVLFYRTNAYVTQEFHSLLEDETKNGFGGLVLIESNNKEVLCNSYGLKTKNTKDLKNNFSFSMGSITKLLTATAIYKLQCDGRLDLDFTLDKYFDNVPIDKQQITIEHLLNHTSGLVNYVGDDYEVIDKEELLLKIWNAPLISGLGEEFNYSNAGYSVLAMIIEIVSNESYEKYIHDNLFLPSGMENTGYIMRKSEDLTEINGYYNNGNAWGNFVDKPWLEDGPSWTLRGNGGFLTTLKDLRKMITIYEDGSKILEPCTLNQIRNRFFTRNGLMGSYIMGEGGGNGIFNVTIEWNLSRKSGVILMSNTEGHYAEEILIDSFTGKKLLLNLLYL